LRDIARHDCVQLNKPVTPAEILNTIAKVLRGSIAKRAVQRTPPRAPVLATVSRAPESLPANAATPGAGTNIYIVDDDSEVCDSLRLVFEEHGSDVETFPSAEAFLAWRDAEPSVSGCLVVDARLPGISGVELLRRLAGAGRAMPSLLITGHGDVDMAVQAMKAGASDFIEKPVSMQELLASVTHAMAQSHDTAMVSERNQMAATQIGELTARQREILDLVLLGHPSKNIAADLGISRRTVENHRAAIMRKTGSRSLPALARLALAAAEIGHA
jgi:two-component system CheB/CheR fusion protein